MSSERERNLSRCVADTKSLPAAGAAQSVLCQSCDALRVVVTFKRSKNWSE
jgi:hypothetical protein